MITRKNTIKSTVAAALCVAGLGLSSAAMAADSNSGTFFGKNAPGKWIIGLKVANIDPDVNEFREIDPGLDEVQDASGIGIVLGYEFARSIGSGGSSTFELEYISGDEEGAGPFIEYETNLLNAFFTYRSAGTLYFKVKAGISYSDLEIDSLLGDDIEKEDTALAAGVGLGFRVKDYGVIEIEYSQDAGDADLGILGLNALLEF